MVGNYRHLIIEERKNAIDSRMLGKRAYVDFEPFSKWNKGEDNDSLEIHIHGFTKDQLRVQVNSHGNLLVTGERSLEDKRWSQFRHEFQLSKEHCLNSIHAKLGNGVLHIIVPRKDANHPPLCSQQAANEKRKSDSKESHREGTDPQIGGPNGEEIGGERLWLKGSCWRLGFVNRKRVLQVSIALFAAAAIGVGTYLASKYWANHHEIKQMNHNILPSLRRT